MTVSLLKVKLNFLQTGWFWELILVSDPVCRLVAEELWPGYGLFLEL